VTQQRTIHGAQALADQLQQALTSRIVIEQAKGVIAQMHNVSVEEAFDVVRAFARRHRRPITSVAQDVIANPDILG
jgi:AmiR/NasT family two-component response regulator